LEVAFFLQALTGLANKYAQQNMCRKKFFFTTISFKQTEDTIKSYRKQPQFGKTPNPIVRLFNGDKTMRYRIFAVS
jgi:hypothetical protein